MSVRALVVATLGVALSACSEPALWKRLNTPLRLCGAGGPVDVDALWLEGGRGLRLPSEPGAPVLRLRGASMTDEYYAGDEYRLEIQLGGVVTLNRPDGSVLRDC